MTPVSYQGPRADEGGQDSTSQDVSLAFEKAQSNTTVGNVLGQTGSNIFAITETMSLAAAVAELNAKGIGILPVIDNQGGLVGVLSERDVVRAVANPDGTPLTATVAEFMTPDPQTCTAEDKLTDVMQRMTEGRFRHMPVLQADNLAGMISIRDIVNNRVKELELEALRIKQLMVG